MAPPAQALEQLLGRAALGERGAFQELYRATAPKLFGVALRILRREDWAEEVLQECYVSVWRHAAEYRPGLAAPMTWMTSIVRNRCLDWLRRPKFEVSDVDGEIAEATPTAEEGPLARLERSGEAAGIARCLQGLDAKQRQAIMLAFYDGLSHAELASHLREPLGTVKTWVRRGLLRLKSCLEDAA